VARRPSAAPRAGVEEVAAAYALKGSERAAAAFLGIARSTVNGILRGIHGAGPKTTAAIARVPDAERAQISKTAQSLTSGRQPQAVVTEARSLAEEERKAPGATERRVAEHEQRMAAQGLDLAGRDRYDRAGRRRSPGQDLSWQELQRQRSEGTLDVQRYRVEIDRMMSEEADLLAELAEEGIDVAEL
jgi:DNA-binding transcriptional regulator YdaS (Cro superfamily)